MCCEHTYSVEAQNYKRLFLPYHTDFPDGLKQFILPFVMISGLMSIICTRIRIGLTDQQTCSNICDDALIDYARVFAGRCIIMDTCWIVIV